MKYVKPEEIEEFKSGPPLHVYIGTMRTKRGISKIEKRAYGVRLIGGLITTLLEMIDRHITFDTFYARSEIVDGIRTLKHLHFSQISSTRNYQNFALKLDSEPGKEILRKYKQALERRNMPEEELGAFVRKR
jgi:hypothetical protein